MPGKMESTAEASYESALREKEAGNACFASNPDLALERYVRALKLLGGEDSVVVATADANALACKVHTNAAAAALKIGDVAGAMDHCKLALAIDARNVKALFRMAEGLKRSGSYREAYAYLERALLVEENNEDIKEAMDECEDLLEFQEGSSDDLIVDDDEDLLAGSPGAEAELPDEVREAALLKIEELREDVLGNVREHVMLSHGSNAFGRIDIVDAFKSSGNLASALKFVRSQHFSSTAQFAVSAPLSLSLSLSLISDQIRSDPIRRDS